MGRIWAWGALLGSFAAAGAACFSWRESQGGGEDSDSNRPVKAADVAVLAGYTIDPVATGSMV